METIRRSNPKNKINDFYIKSKCSLSKSSNKNKKIAKKNNETVTKNLNKKFEKMTNENSNSKIGNFNDTSTKHLNEILNKINYYKQIINFKEELNNIFIQEASQFIDTFINMFKRVEITDENLLMMKESFNITEKLISENSKSITSDDKSSMIIDNLFESLQLQLKNKNDEKLDDMINKMNKIIEFVLIESDYKQMNLKNNNKNQNLTNKIENNLPQNEEFNKIINNSKKFFSTNSHQIFLIKDDGIFSESNFFNVDQKFLHSHKLYKFYRIKCYFSIDENNTDIRSYLLTIRDFFITYFLSYKKNKIPNKKFIKIQICGLGKRLLVMKNLIIKFIGKNVKKDCLFKISLFSKLEECLAPILNKLNNQNIEENDNCLYYCSNLSQETLSNLL